MATSSIKYLTDIDLNYNQLLNARVQQLDTIPVTPGAEGQLIWDSQNNKLYIYNGVAWEIVGETYTLTSDLVAGVGADLVLTGEDIGNQHKVRLQSGTNFSITESGNTIVFNVVQDPSFTTSTIGAIRIGINANNQISTTSGDLVLDSFSGTTLINDNLIVAGDLTVNGTVTTVNTEVINLADNIIKLNSNLSDASYPTQDAGLEIERGSEQNKFLLWDEINQEWTIQGLVWDNTLGMFITKKDSFAAKTFKSTTVDEAPFIVNSNIKVNNLNADLLDDQDGSYYKDWSTATNKTSPVINLSGDLSGSVTLTELENGPFELNATINSNSVELGVDTTGDYVAEVYSGTGIVVSGSGQEGASVTISHADTSALTEGQPYGTVGISSITVDGMGHITDIATGSFMRRYAQNLTDSRLSYLIPHNLNSQDLTVTIREVNEPYNLVMTDIEFTNLNNITVKFNEAPAPNIYRVVVIG